MFNVFTLLLDDALKPATPLIAPLVSGVAGLNSLPLFKTYRKTVARVKCTDTVPG